MDHGRHDGVTARRCAPNTVSVAARHTAIKHEFETEHFLPRRIGRDGRPVEQTEAGGITYCTSPVTGLGQTYATSQLLPCSAADEHTVNGDRGKDEKAVVIRRRLQSVPASVMVVL